MKNWPEKNVKNWLQAVWGYVNMNNEEMRSISFPGQIKEHATDSLYCGCFHIVYEDGLSFSGLIMQQRNGGFFMQEKNTKQRFMPDCPVMMGTHLRAIV